jgi:hypothetical protein
VKLAALLWASVAFAAPTGEAAFTQLHSLVGEWSATTDSGGVIKVSYRTVSNDSVLVESYVTASGKETLTLFHRDGATVMATHYCGQQNQPRLTLDAKSKPQMLVFTFKDATNLKSAATEHLTRLTVNFVDATHFDLSETYSASGKSETTTLHFQKLN